MADVVFAIRLRTIGFGISKDVVTRAAAMHFMTPKLESPGLVSCYTTIGHKRRSCCLALTIGCSCAESSNTIQQIIWDPSMHQIVLCAAAVPFPQAIYCSRFARDLGQDTKGHTHATELIHGQTRLQARQDKPQLRPPEDETGSRLHLGSSPRMSTTLPDVTTANQQVRGMWWIGRGNGWDWLLDCLVPTCQPDCRVQGDRGHGWVQSINV